MSTFPQAATPNLMDNAIQKWDKVPQGSENTTWHSDFQGQTPPTLALLESNKQNSLRPKPTTGFSLQLSQVVKQRTYGHSLHCNTGQQGRYQDATPVVFQEGRGATLPRDQANSKGGDG